MTTPPSRTRTPARPGLWVGSLFVLAGLFGMHGLASHGICDMPAMVGTAAAEMALPHVGHGSMPGVPSSGVAPGLRTAMSDSITATTEAGTVISAGRLGDLARVAAAGGHGSSHGLVGLCVAVLSTALIILLASGTHRPGRGRTMHLDGGGVSLRTVGRDRDPPSLTWLSIRRC